MGRDGEGEGAQTPSVIRPTDAASVSLARRLVRGARFGAISVLEPETGHPFVSRVLVATDVDGVPVMIGSSLATHTKALLDDPRCSLLLGEPGKGDPLAWPRISLLCTAEKIDHESESDGRIRARFLRRHQKARLYASFRDFSFFRLVPNSANLNGGFGRAYIILQSELMIESAFNQELCTHEEHYLAELKKLGCGGADLLAKLYFKEKSENWYISGLDADGLDLARKESVHRLEFVNRITNSNGLIAEYENLLMGKTQN